MKKAYLTFFGMTALFAATIFTIVSVNSCATLNALAGLTRAEFKLQDAVNVRLMGIDLANKHSIKDFSIVDGINLFSAFNSGKMPLTFTLNVAARNPNKHDPNSSLSAISLAEFPWRMLIDGRETITGGIGSAVALPDGGQTTVIPLQVSVDLKKFFADKGYEDIANLALAISGQGASKLALKATPKLSTPIGSMTYPHELTIVSTQFTN